MAPKHRPLNHRPLVVQVKQDRQAWKEHKKDKPQHKASSCGFPKDLLKWLQGMAKTIPATKETPVTKEMPAVKQEPSTPTVSVSSTATFESGATATASSESTSHQVVVVHCDSDGFNKLMDDMIAQTQAEKQVKELSPWFPNSGQDRAKWVEKLMREIQEFSPHLVAGISHWWTWHQRQPTFGEQVYHWPKKVQIHVSLHARQDVDIENIISMMKKTRLMSLFAKPNLAQSLKNAMARLYAEFSLKLSDKDCTLLINTLKPEDGDSQAKKDQGQEEMPKKMVTLGQATLKIFELFETGAVTRICSAHKRCAIAGLLVALLETETA